ncbi:hypothetical protein A8B73_13145 [Methylosinus sp. 3S-1]|nr:hypothetical protein A8B73_13145 [Methylosinus sp. 3S-1]
MAWVSAGIGRMRKLRFPVTIEENVGRRIGTSKARRRFHGRVDPRLPRAVSQIFVGSEFVQGAGDRCWRGRQHTAVGFPFWTQASMVDLNHPASIADYHVSQPNVLAWLGWTRHAERDPTEE